MCCEIPGKKNNNDNHYPLYIYVLTQQPNDQLQRRAPGENVNRSRQQQTEDNITR
jgi:hypothetical protein